MQIRTFKNKYTDENTYVLLGEGGTAVVIDPGTDIFAMENNCIDIKYIILTHCHYDHTSELDALKKKTGATVVFSREAKENLNNSDINLCKMFSGDNILTPPDLLVSDNDVIDTGEFSIKCISTPGHTSCGMCYICEKNIFSGDTLFYRNVGRWDFPTGNSDILFNSIKNKIYVLDEEFKIYPGHGEITFVGDEKKNNSFIRE